MGGISLTEIQAVAYDAAVVRCYDRQLERAYTRQDAAWWSGMLTGAIVGGIGMFICFVMFGG